MSTLSRTLSLYGFSLEVVGRDRVWLYREPGTAVEVELYVPIEARRGGLPHMIRPEEPVTVDPPR